MTIRSPCINNEHFYATYVIQTDLLIPCPKDECECFTKEEVNAESTIETEDEIIVANPNIVQGNTVLAARPWSPTFSLYRPIPARFQHHRGPYILLPYGK